MNLNGFWMQCKKVDQSRRMSSILKRVYASQGKTATHCWFSQGQCEFWLKLTSSGQTRPPPAPLLSEAQSYLAIAQAMSLLPAATSSLPASGPLPLTARVTTEEFALDSYQNLLFAIARFREFTGNYPQKITVVGYGMKRNRFVIL